jgi:pimeloyl-ACP methyl ester carboxylesterase
MECLVAHDWGGAVAWNLANQQPQLIKRLAIVNSPHPGTFLRELKTNPKQQAASAYMNFLIRPDAEALLAENDFARMWPFFSKAKDGASTRLADRCGQGPVPRRLGRGPHRGLQLLPRVAAAPAAARRPGAAAIELPDTHADGERAHAGGLGPGRPWPCRPS